jgi:TRAP-type C4-dicarboxylate transport system permease small subunit
VKTAAQFGLVALVALVLTFLPGGEGTLRAALTVLTILFFAAIAWFGYTLYKRNRSVVDELSQRQRLVLYSSFGLAFLTVTATNRLFDEGGVGVLAWLALLGLCSYGVFWVWTTYRSYG